MLSQVAPSTTIVAPVYNEVEALGTFLPQLLEHSVACGWRLIIVDDGSTDGTGELLKSHADAACLTVIKHRLNKGYGAALKSGIRAARTEYVVTIDGDGQHRIEDASVLLKIINESGADLVVGSRNKSSGFYRDTGKWFLRRVASLMLAVNIRDLNSGFKVYRTDIAQRYARLCPDGMSFSEVLTLVFISQRHLVLEAPVTVDKRRAGQSKISTRTAFETFLEIVNIIMLFAPSRVFIPIAAVCLMAGVLWGLPLVMLGRGVTVGAMLAVVTGVIFLFLGLLSEQLAAIRRDLFLHGREET